MKHFDRRIRLSASILVAATLTCGAVGCDDDRSATAEEPSAAPSDESSPGTPAKRPPSAADDDRFATEVDPEDVPAGSESDVQLAIAAGDGLKVNREYPSWSFEVESAEGIELDKRTFSREDFDLSKGAARARATVRGRRAGEATISGTANFSVCNDETCHIMRDEPVRFRVRVTESTGSESNAKAE